MSSNSHYITTVSIVKKYHSRMQVMHDNSLTAIAALKVVMSVSCSIGSNVSRLFTMLFTICCTISVRYNTKLVS